MNLYYRNKFVLNYVLQQPLLEISKMCYSILIICQHSKTAKLLYNCML